MKYLNLLTIFFLSLPVFAEQWYAPISRGDHENPGSLSFLMGNWKSTNPNVLITESWSFSALDSYIGVRTESPPVERDLIIFEHTRYGSLVSMHRICSDATETLVGKWSTPSQHRAILSFKSSDGKTSKMFKYDSPSIDALKIETQIIKNGKTLSRVDFLKRI